MVPKSKQETDGQRMPNEEIRLGNQKRRQCYVSHPYRRHGVATSSPRKRCVRVEIEWGMKERCGGAHLFPKHTRIIELDRHQNGGKMFSRTFIKQAQLVYTYMYTYIYTVSSVILHPFYAPTCPSSRISRAALADIAVGPRRF